METFRNWVVVIIIFSIIIWIYSKKISKKEAERKKELDQYYAEKKADLEKRDKDIKQQLRMQEERELYSFCNIIFCYNDINQSYAIVLEDKSNIYEVARSHERPFILNEVLKIKKDELVKFRILSNEEKEEKIRKYETLKFDSFKFDYELFQEFIDYNQILKLYHFTDRLNIQSIKKNGGLYSWKYCESNEIEILKSGGGSLSKDLDRQHNLENYVRLTFVTDHPMMFVARKEGRISNPVILEIDPQIIYLKETRFSNVNATTTGHLQGKTIDDLKKVNFEVFKQNYFDLNNNDKQLYQAEVMVLEKIPLHYILNINQV